MYSNNITQRMKENYESRNSYYLLRKTPVIMRVDGKCFHNYTSKLKKPFDLDLIEAMNQTALYLCYNIQGAKYAYVQSDEISILILDTLNHNSEAWFDYNIQKMTSIGASLATAKFNQERFKLFIKNLNIETHICDIEFDKFPIAEFDARVFNIPENEVSNYFLSRKQDCERNSLNMIARTCYSHKELQGKKSNELQEMIFQKGFNWNDLDPHLKKGRLISKNIDSKWIIIPMINDVQYVNFLN